MPQSLATSFGYRVISEWLNPGAVNLFYSSNKPGKHIINGESGLVNAPTGCGKTFSVFLGALIDFINHHPDDLSIKSKEWLTIAMDHSTPCIGKRYWPCHGRSDC